MRYVTTALVLCLLMPAAAIAAEHEVRVQIRAALLTDPETAQLSVAELDALVTALAAEAHSAGLTSDDLAWQPRAERVVASAPSAPPCAGIHCALVRFGMSARMLQIALGALTIGGILWFTAYEFRHRMPRA